MSARRWLGLLISATVLVVLGLWRASGPSSRLETPPAAFATPVRIASLTLGTDEMLAELVPAERIACVTYLADDPEISNIPRFYPARVPRLRDTTPERIIGLNPDLVCVAAYNTADFLKVVERSGLPVYRNEACQSMDEIEAGILALGKRVDEPRRAQEVVERMQSRRQRLAEQLRDIPRRPRVLFWSAGFTAGDGSTIDDIIREGGAINVAVERGIHGSAAIAPEQVIAAMPEFILLCQWSADEREGRIENHPLLRNLGAVREKRVIAIEGRYLTSVSQHVVAGAERLARRLHPERFEPVAAE